MAFVLQKLKRSLEQQNIASFLQSLNQEDIRALQCTKKIQKEIIRLLKIYTFKHKKTEAIGKITSFVKGINAHIFRQQEREQLASQKSRYDIKDIDQLFQVQQHSCLGCLKYLVDGKPLPSTKQIYTILGKDYNDQILKQFIKIKACALLNTRCGGYLFLTAKENQINCIVGTQQLSNVNNFDSWKQIIKDAIVNSIFPNNFQCQIEQIQVRNPDMKLTKRSLIRVTLISDKNVCLYVIDKKFGHTKKQSIVCSFINPSRLGMSDDVIKTQNTAWIYDILLLNNIFCLQQRKNNKYPVRNEGEKTTCLKLNLQDAIQYYENLHSKIRQDSKALVTKVDEELKFTYKNFTLLVFANQAGNQNAQKLKKAMYVKKQNFFLVKPFQNITHKSIKSIWYMGHDCQLPSVIDMLQKFISQDRYMPTPITLTKYILIKSQPPSKINQYLKTYESTFKTQPQYFKTNQDKFHQITTYDYYFKYESYKYTIYTYIYLDNQRIKCVLIKESIFKVQKQKYFMHNQY